MSTSKFAGARLLLVLIFIAFIASCGGGGMTTVIEENPPVTPETVYFQLIGTYKLAGNRDQNDVNSSHILRPTWNVGGALWTNLPSDQGKVIHVGVKNGVGELAVGYYTDAQIADTSVGTAPNHPMRWRQLDREQASGRPVLAYLTEVGTNKNAVVYSYNGSEELTGAMVRWQKGVPFGVKIPFRNRVDATPQGLGEVGARLNGIQFMAAWIERTITIRERSNSSWLVAAVVGLAQVAAAMPPACPGEENNSWLIFDDLGGNDTVVPNPPVQNQRPNADFDWIVDQLCVEFDASDSSDPDGSIVRYRWDFQNDGTWDFTSTTTPLADHCYPAAGTYTVKLEVTDDRGAQDDVTKSVTVTKIVVPPANNPPIASLIAQPSSGTAPLTTTLNASGSHDPDGTIVKYEWDYTNDGTYDAATTVPTSSYTYQTAATYTARVRVTDNAGATDTTTTTIVVNPPTVTDPYDLSTFQYLTDDLFVDPFQRKEGGVWQSATLDVRGNIVLWDEEGDDMVTIPSDVTFTYSDTLNLVNSSGILRSFYAIIDPSGDSTNANLTGQYTDIKIVAKRPGHPDKTILGRNWLVPNQP